MANADTPDGAIKAVEFGAMGIGLCRTERMFNDVDRLPIVKVITPPCCLSGNNPIT